MEEAVVMFGPCWWMGGGSWGKEKGVFLTLRKLWSLDQCGPKVNLPTTKQAPQLSVGTEKLYRSCDG